MKRSKRNIIGFKVILNTVFAIFVSGSSLAGDTSSADALHKYLTTPELTADLFSPRFLEKVSFEEIRVGRPQIIETFGKFCSVSPLRDHLLQHIDRGTVNFEGGTMDVKVVLDLQGRIDELMFFNPIVMNGDIDGAVQTITNLPGSVGIVISEGGKIVKSHNPNLKAHIPHLEPVALLDAVHAAVDQGRLAWETPVPWRKEWVARGSRVLSDWPVGHPLTVRVLINFALQNEESAITALHSILSEASASQPVPMAEMSPIELCNRIGALKADGGLSIWQGPATTLGWDSVTYKGGTDATTSNHTMVLQTDDRNVCISTTWQNEKDGIGALQFYQAVRSLAGTMLKKSRSCPKSPIS